MRGGFAFQNAPFASHPLDAERARRMMFMALRANATPARILNEARHYLNEAVGLGTAPINEQLARVDRFLSAFRLVKKKKSAWLIFWNGVPSIEADQPREIVTIMDSRRSIERVQEFLEQYYMAANYSLREKMHFATRPGDNPYRARVAYNHEQMRFVSINCGHNPWLEARYVKNLRLEHGPDDQELLTWE